MTQVPSTSTEPRSGGRLASDRAARLVEVLIPVALVVMLLLVDIPTCPTRVMFGVPCPGCGMTRAARALLTGDLGAALRMNPAVFFVGPLAAYWLWQPAAEALGLARPRFTWRVPAWTYGALLVLLLGVWGLRLAGALGGHPDGVHWEQGMLLRIAKALAQGTGS